MAPRGFSDKDERQYEKIKQSERNRGVGSARAKEIAARTVNKTRRKQGRTPNKTTQGTGNPNTSLGDRTKRELYNLAAQRDVAGRSKMNKQQLVRALKK